MNIGNITSNNFNLDVTGKDIQIEVYEQLIGQLQQENKQLKSNWNNLKEYLNEGTFYYKTGNGEYTTEMVSNRINGLDTLRKMQELEQGSDSNE